MTLSKENLQFIEDYDTVEPGEAAALPRELLALRERAEPFGYYSPEVPTILEQQGYANISRECAGEYRLPLYTTPPAPVVPEEIAAALIAAIEKEQDRLFGQDYLMDSKDCIDVIREEMEWLKVCRAAMLQGAEPVSQPYKLPDGWIKCSQRMPGRDGGYLTWDGRNVSNTPFFFGSWQANQFIARNITHWMPLPSAPGKEG